MVVRRLILAPHSTAGVETLTTWLAWLGLPPALEAHFMDEGFTYVDELLEAELTVEDLEELGLPAEAWAVVFHALNGDASGPNVFSGEDADEPVEAGAKDTTAYIVCMIVSYATCTAGGGQPLQEGAVPHRLGRGVTTLEGS